MRTSRLLSATLLLGGLLLLSTSCGRNAHSVLVPRIDGAHLDVALERLHQVGLRATFGTATMTCGYTTLPTVTHQKPRAGTPVPPATAVTFKFGHELIPSGGGGGKTHVVVPSLLGLSQQ